MLVCFALGLLRFPWGLSGLLSLIDFFIPWMLKAVAALNFGACMGALLCPCGLCFGGVWLCLALGVLACCGAFLLPQLNPRASLRAALSDWRVPALPLRALPLVGFALPLVGFALPLRALPCMGFALPCMGFALPLVGFALALPALPCMGLALPCMGLALALVGFALALPALPCMGLALPCMGLALPCMGFALPCMVLGAWGAWCWVLGVGCLGCLVLGAWCWVLGVLGVGCLGCWVLGVLALAPAPWGRLSFLRFALQTPMMIKSTMKNPKALPRPR